MRPAIKRNVPAHSRPLALTRLSQANAAYRAAPTIAELFPDSHGFALELEFRDAGVRVRSPYRRLFMPTMHAVFRVPCVLADCVSGGFDLGADVGKLLSRRRDDHASVSQCPGRRPGGTACGIELRFSLATLP